MGGDLFRLSKEQTDELIRLPFHNADASTALSPAEQRPQIQETTPEIEAALGHVAQSFGSDKRGQGEFGF